MLEFKLSPSGDLGVLLLYPPIVVSYGSNILLRDAPLAPIVCRPTWVRCVAMRLLHLLCFGLYDTVAVSVGTVVERPLRGHRCRNKISGAADEAIETVMNLRKLQLGVCMRSQGLQ